MNNTPKNTSEKKNVLNPVNICDFNYYNYKITGQRPLGKSIFNYYNYKIAGQRPVSKNIGQRPMLNDTIETSPKRA